MPLAALALLEYETATPMMIARMMAMIVPMINHIYIGHKERQYKYQVKDINIVDRKVRANSVKSFLLSTLMFFHHIFFFNSLALRLKTPAWF